MTLLDETTGEAWLWVGGSLLLGILWTNLSWLFSPWVEADRSPEPSRSLAETVIYRVGTWRFAPSLFEALRFLYYVGLPSAALFWGRDAVVGRLLGLKRLTLPAQTGAGGSGSLNANWTTWVHDLGWAAILGLGSTGLLVLAAVTYRRGLQTVTVFGRDGDVRGWKAAREAVYNEIHWTFYRNAPIVALGLYWGTWVGLALVAVEAIANPAWRNDVQEPGRAWPRLSRAALAVVSCLLFLQTQNLWLALLLHWSISWLLEVMQGAPSSAPADAASAGE